MKEKDQLHQKHQDEIEEIRAQFEKEKSQLESQMHSLKLANDRIQEQLSDQAQ